MRTSWYILPNTMLEELHGVGGFAHDAVDIDGTNSLVRIEHYDENKMFTFEADVRVAALRNPSSRKNQSAEAMQKLAALNLPIQANDSTADIIDEFIKVKGSQHVRRGL
jgi:hypothetical protein